LPNRPQLLGSLGEVVKGVDPSFVNLEKQGPAAVRRSPVHAVRVHFRNQTWEGRVRAQERNSNRNTNADHMYCRRVQIQRLHTPARATPSGSGEAQADPFPPVRPGHPRAEDPAAPAEGTRKTKCPKELRFTPHSPISG